MPASEKRGKTSLLFTLAAFVVVVAGMRAASSLMVPFLLSVFIAVISFPLLDWLHERGAPQAMALLIVILGVALIGFSISMLVAGSIGDFTRAIPLYQARLGEETRELLAWLEGLGVAVPAESVQSILDPAAAMRLASGLLSSLNAMLSNAFLILLTVSFILMEAWSMPEKLRVAFPGAETGRLYIAALSEKVRQYVGLKTIVSLATGLLIGIWLSIIDVNFALLWGLLAFLLNFIPTIGSILAAIPAVILAFIQFGIPSALLAAAGYLMINFIIGSILEPKFLGQEVGLSTLVVFLSLIFWGWVFGPIGMLLSIPLTMTVKIFLDHSEGAKWLGTALGSQVPDQED